MSNSSDPSRERQEVRSVSRSGSRHSEEKSPSRERSGYSNRLRYEYDDGSKNQNDGTNMLTPSYEV